MVFFFPHSSSLHFFFRQMNVVLSDTFFILHIVGDFLDVEELQAIWMCNVTFRSVVNQHLEYLVNILKDRKVLNPVCVCPTVKCIYEQLHKNDKCLISVNGKAPTKISRHAGVTYTIRDNNKRQRCIDTVLNNPSPRNYSNVAVIDATNHKKRLKYSNNSKIIRLVGCRIYVWHM